MPTPASSPSASKPFAARSSSSERLVEAPLLARDLGQRRLARRAPVDVAQALGERERLALDLLRAAPVADEFEHLAELEQHLDALALLDQRRQPLEVLDRGGVGVRRLRGVAGAAEVLALLAQVLAVPEVVGEQRRVALDRVGLGQLDEAAHALVQHRPEREGHALVGDLLRDDVLEQVGLLALLLDARAGPARRASRRWPWTASYAPSSG